MPQCHRATEKVGRGAAEKAEGRATEKAKRGAAEIVEDDANEQSELV